MVTVNTWTDTGQRSKTHTHKRVPAHTRTPSHILHLASINRPCWSVQKDGEGQALIKKHDGSCSKDSEEGGKCEHQAPCRQAAAAYLSKFCILSTTSINTHSLTCLPKQREISQRWRPCRVKSYKQIFSKNLACQLSKIWPSATKPAIKAPRNKLLIETSTTQ